MTASELKRSNPFRTEKYNQRVKYNIYYTNPALKHLNESWISESVKTALERIEKTYRENGSNSEKKIFVSPLRELSLELKEYHRMWNLHRIRERLSEELNIKVIQMYIHRDTYHDKDWTKKDISASIIFDWTDNNGNLISLKKKEFSAFESIIAEELQKTCLGEFEKIMQSANKSYLDFFSKCGELFHFIEPMIKIYDDDACVMWQSGDGFVLSWEGENYFGKIRTFNTPIDSIVREFEITKDVLTMEDLREISI